MQQQLCPAVRVRGGLGLGLGVGLGLRVRVRVSHPRDTGRPDDAAATLSQHDVRSCRRASVESCLAR
eukprot:scaffold69120_cov63-Phaeocystis_antarctica.AAC.1